MALENTTVKEKEIDGRRYSLCQFNDGSYVLYTQKGYTGTDINVYFRGGNARARAERVYDALIVAQPDSYQIIS